MFCSKCGRELNNTGVCENCSKKHNVGAGIVGTAPVRKKNVAAVKNVMLLLAILLLIECLLICQPTVEIRSELLGVTKQIGMFDFQRSSALKTMLVGIHLLAIAALLFPCIVKRNWKRMYALPAAAASAVTLCLLAGISINVDELVSENNFGELLNYAYVDVGLTVSAVILLVLSIVVLAGAVYLMVIPPRKQVGDVQREDGERNYVTVREALHISKKDMKEFAVVLVALCMATSVGIAIPSIVRSLFSQSIVGKWYTASEDSGDAYCVVFNKDNTCEIDGYPVAVLWEAENGQLTLSETFGNEYTYDYEWEGNKLIINGIEFSRNP